MTIPHWAPPDPRDADLLLRRDRAPSGSSGSRRPTRRCPCRSRPGSGDPRRARVLPRRPGPVPHRDRRSSPTSCCPPPGGERRPGRFTNVNRTVHLSEKAVEPPGEARSDLDIFLTTPTRWASPTGRNPLLTWRRPEEAFEAWQECSPRPARRLHRPHLRQAPRPQRHPVAGQRGASGRHRPALRRRRLPHRPRLLRDLRPRPAHRRHRRAEAPSQAPAGRAFLKGRDYRPPHEEPDGRLPAPVSPPAAPPTSSTPAPKPDVPGTDKRGPNRVGGTLPGRRRPAGNRRRRPRQGRVAAGPIEVPARVSDIRKAPSSHRFTTAIGTRTVPPENTRRLPTNSR